MTHITVDDEGKSQVPHLGVGTVIDQDGGQLAIFHTLNLSTLEIGNMTMEFNGASADPCYLIEGGSVLRFTAERLR